MAFSKSISEFRNHVPAAYDWAYLETGGTGLVPDFVYEGVRRYMDDRYFKGGDSVWLFDDGITWTLPMIEKSKEALAQMIHGRPQEIAFGQSATQMFTLVTEGIDYSPEDNIVTVQEGWIGSRYAWQKRQAEGLEVRFVYPEEGRITAKQMIEQCDSHTRAMAINLVESSTGFRMDVDELGDFCRKNDILFFVDGVQALGVLQIDVQRSNIDFLVGNDYKWMMNFCGTGYAYISQRVRKQIRHWGAGWMSDTDRFNTTKEHWEPRMDAGRFEIGHQHNDGIYGLGLVAAQYNLLGGESIERYVCDLAEDFRLRVQASKGVRLSYNFPKKNCSQIVSIKTAREMELDNEDFKKAKVFMHLREPDQTGEREMRVCFHYYNNKEDIDRFFAVVDACNRR
ncbi:MAG: aminotransferase class V-fold PLP-dependent enzyme [Lachnospiraceae bacterium]|nr:aminotransferase class V-fold PLP-dependent enzyme [Lachnospiraceae bacterium]